MLCSVCNKNVAIIFTNKPSTDGKNNFEGYCYNCAKEKGINPLEVLAKQAASFEGENFDLNDMTEQFETLFNDISENLNKQDIEIQNLAPQSTEGVPIGSILGNIFGTSVNSENENSKQNGNKRVKVDKKTKEKKKRVLDIYGTNLTNKAKNNQLDQVIGRDKEIQRMIQILNRRLKNNPCLIGEPGVGKTAIAQGLAIKIANGKVPAKLLNKEVYLLDMTSVIAGTQFRGQFEARMKAIIDECKSLGNIILVIDEIHNIIGAGDSENSMNAANILKPSLANGDIQLIGTTTLREYRKYIEKDTAL